MLKIINLSTYSYDMDRYNNNCENINKFLKKRLTCNTMRDIVLCERRY